MMTSRIRNTMLCNSFRTGWVRRCRLVGSVTGRPCCDGPNISRRNRAILILAGLLLFTSRHTCLGSARVGGVRPRRRLGGGRSMGSPVRGSRSRRGSDRMGPRCGGVVRGGVARRADRGRTDSVQPCTREPRGVAVIHDAGRLRPCAARVLVGFARRAGVSTGAHRGCPEPNSLLSRQDKYGGYASVTVGSQPEDPHGFSIEPRTPRATSPAPGSSMQPAGAATCPTCSLVPGATTTRKTDDQDHLCRRPPRLS